MKKSGNAPALAIQRFAKTPAPIGVNYWWLNANPKIWKLQELPIGGKETYSSHNDKGNKRKIYKWFQEVKPGDLVVGYVTAPQSEVVAICKITKGLHQSGNGEEIEFKKVEHFGPISYEALRAIPQLEDCEPFKFKQGSLFKLTEQEYQVIRRLKFGDFTLIKDIQNTTERALVYARVGQGKFGWAVRQLWNNRCAVTGSSTQKAIEACHIKCWADSNNIERLDPNNGLLLTASLHKLFDAGYISFEASGKMIVSPELSRAEQKIFGIIGKRLSKKPSVATAKYLAYHRNQMFLRK
jgi:hypothetical protein